MKVVALSLHCCIIIHRSSIFLHLNMHRYFDRYHSCITSTCEDVTIKVVEKPLNFPLFLQQSPHLVYAIVIVNTNGDGDDDSYLT